MSSYTFVTIWLLFLTAVNAEWELMVCLGDRVELLGSNGETLGSRSLGLGTDSRPDILSLDTLSGNVFLADSRHPNTSIFSLPLKRVEPPIPPRPVVPRESRMIQGVAYDLVERAVYWTTGRDRRIMRSILYDQTQGLVPVIDTVHAFTNEVPHGIAVDSCRRKLYWSNCNLTGPSIEVSGLSGNERQMLVTKDLFQPLGLALSQGDGWLYWADEGPGYSFTVERIRLDGSVRELLVKSSHQQPLSLAVVPGEHVFWTDHQRQALWKLDLSIELASTEPVLVREYKDSVPSGLVALRQDSKLDTQSCSNVIKLKNQIGSWVSTSYSCPVEYCLHNGTCTGGESLSCKCRVGYMGDRCQYETRLCSAYCLDSSSITDIRLTESCQCSGVEKIYKEVSSALLGRGLDSVSSKWRLATLCLSGFCAVFVMIIAALAIKTHALSKRPKLRRRYTVTRGKPPGSSGGQSSLDKSQCEIGDIENCCNMNICETPCYEPEFRTPGKGGGKTKGVESRSLISDMEVPEPSHPPSLL